MMHTLCTDAGSKRACSDCKRNPDNVPHLRELANASWTTPPKGEKCHSYVPVPARRAP